MTKKLSRVASFCLRLTGLLALFLLVATSNAPYADAFTMNGSANELTPAQKLLNADGTLDTSGFNGGIDLRGWNVTLDPTRGPIFAKSKTGQGPTPANVPPSKPSAVPTSWSAMPFNGFNTTGYVRAIVQAPNPGVGNGNAVYFGGEFTGSGDSPQTFSNLGRIARYYNGVWWPLPHGGIGSGKVYAMAVVGSYIYVGGNFTQNADGNLAGSLNNIARYDTVTDTWQPLPNGGLNGTVWSLAVTNGHLYVGGDFTKDATNTTALNYIARYDGAASWTALSHNGLNGSVYALAVNGNNVYVGGSFSQTQDTLVADLNNIALYTDNTLAWSALANKGLSGTVEALAYNTSNSKLYVGGMFTSALNPTVTLNRIATYNGTWGAITDGTQPGLNNNVYAIAINGSDIYVGGMFTQNSDGSKNLASIALLNGSTFSALPNSGLNNTVFSIATVGTLPYDVYVGGSFDKTQDTSKNLSYAASLGNLCTAASSGNWSAGGTWGCGGSPTGTDSVTVQNGATVTIDVDNVIIDGPMTVNGTIDATAHVLTLGASAVVAGTGQIIGSVVRHSPGNGTHTYNNSNTQITLSGSSLNAITVTLTMGAPGQLTNYVARKYTITPGTGTFTSASLRLPYQTSEFTNIVSEANLKLWRHNGTKWVLQGGTADTINHFVELAGVTNFSPWAITDNGAGAPTAVTLTNLSASADNSSTLVWVAGISLACVVMLGAWTTRRNK